MIYFVRAEQDTDTIKAGWIKIVTTIRLSVRLQQIAFEIGHTPTVLAILDGAYAEERALHYRFAAYRRYGEWFDPCPSLLSLIEIEGRPWDGKDDIVSTKIDRELAKLAKMVADDREISVAEYLSGLLRGPVLKDAKKVARKIEGKGEPKS